MNVKLIATETQSQHVDKNQDSLRFMVKLPKVFVVRPSVSRKKFLVKSSTYCDAVSDECRRQLSSDTQAFNHKEANEEGISFLQD